MSKPDKLPTIDPRTPNVYRVIVDTAQRVRAERHAVNALGWAEIRARRIESLAFVNRREVDEGPVVWKG